MCAVKSWRLGISALFIWWVITNVLTPVNMCGQTGTAASVQWGTCPPPPTGIPAGNQQCATLSLPLSYQGQSSQTIKVAISKIPAANPGLRRGVLLLNPGGPGGAGLDLPREFSLLLPQTVTDQYDLIGFDPRGVGRSSPLTCGLTQQESEQAFVPLEQPGGFSDTTAFVEKVADNCAASGDSILPFITTANTARDMDQIRQALGESKISYLGYSYGTYLGAVYASLFPDHTDRIVLDSSIDPNWVWRQQFREWGPAGEVRFPDYANFVAANDGIYHLGQTAAQVYLDYLVLVDYLYKNPYAFSDGSILTAPIFRELSFSSLYNDGDFPPLAALWQVLLNFPSDLGAVQKALEILYPLPVPVPGVPIDNGTAAGLAVSCNDIKWSRSVNQYQTDFEADSLLFPLFGPLGSNIWPCAFWSSRPAEPPTSIVSTGRSNILIVQDLRDPAAPYWGALKMHQLLGRSSRMISIDQGGHGAYVLKSNICANDATTAYLAFGLFPITDMFCPENPSSAATREAIDSQAKEKAIQEVLKRMKPF